MSISKQLTPVSLIAVSLWSAPFNTSVLEATPGTERTAGDVESNGIAGGAGDLSFDGEFAGYPLSPPVNDQKAPALGPELAYPWVDDGSTLES